MDNPQREPIESPPGGLTGRDLAARRRRRLALPIASLVMALGVWVWSSNVAKARQGQVEAFARSLLAQAAPPEPSFATIEATQPVIATLVRGQLASLVAEEPSAIQLTIHPGDLPGASGVATHRAEITGHRGRRLVLRIVHPGDVAAITIVGVELGGDPH